jgi:oxalate decarboxylase/phosphoglucose isomerase-like protein (cupin superfamily)
MMWTETKKARVFAGDVIYLPRKQIHSLECTSREGMVLAGSFFPAGSPAVNY